MYQRTTYFLRRDKALGDFTMVHNHYIRNPNLSFKAKGLMTYLLSLPDNWNIVQKEILSHATDGAHAVRTAFQELIQAHYLWRLPVYDRRRIAYWLTVVCEYPERDLEQMLKALRLKMGPSLVTTEMLAYLALLNKEDLAKGRLAPQEPLPNIRSRRAKKASLRLLQWDQDAQEKLQALDQLQDQEA